MLKDWSVNGVRDLVFRIEAEVKSPHRNVHSQWLCKKDLYYIMWLAQEAILRCDDFDEEKQFIKSYQYEKMLKMIRDSDNASG